MTLEGLRLVLPVKQALMVQNDAESMPLDSIPPAILDFGIRFAAPEQRGGYEFYCET